MLNALLREERAIVSSIAGTTRDAIDTHLKWEGQDIVLIDTAGIRRRGRVDPGIEKYSVMRAMSAIQRSDVALLVVDAEAGIMAQDAHVAGFILEEYKSVVVVVNKWDVVPEKDTYTINNFRDTVRQQLHFLDYVPVVFISALTKQRVNKVLPAAMAVAAQRKVRIPTGELNRLIHEAWSAHSPSGRGGRTLKIYYATQANVEPPTFIIFVNDRELVHFSYERYLENRIRDLHPFEGTPLRIVFRSRGEGDDK